MNEFQFNKHLKLYVFSFFLFRRIIAVFKLEHFPTQTGGKNGETFFNV